MNELTELGQAWRDRYSMMSDKELEYEIHRQETMQIMINKPDGMKIVVKDFMIMFSEMLPEFTKKMTDKELAAHALSWARKLSPEYIRVGIKGIRAALAAWIDDDKSPYRTFPKPAWIADKCAELQGSPQREKGLREQMQAELIVEREHADFMEKWKRQHPDRWAEIEQEAARREAAMKGR